MAIESLVVHVRKLLFNKYMKNHKIIFFLFNKVEMKKITEEQLIPLHSALKKKKRDLHCFYSIHD